MHSDFRRIARQVRQLDAEIHARVLWEHALQPSAAWSVPTADVGRQTAEIRHLVWCSGTHLEADLLDKERRVRRPGEVWHPRARMGLPDTRPSPAHWKPSVATSSASRTRAPKTGSENQTGAWVRWIAPANNMARRLAADGLIVQKSIDTGPWRVNCRVSTLFGKPFSRAREADRVDAAPYGTRSWGGGAQGGGMSICSSRKACTFQLNNDREIISWANGHTPHSSSSPCWASTPSASHPAASC